MVTLLFDSESKLTLGPSHSFTLDGLSIRQSPHDEVVCRLLRRIWAIEDEEATSFECTDRTQVQFEDRQGRLSPLYGPFRRLRFEGDRCFTEGRPFAEFIHQTQRWRHLESGIGWHSLRVLTVRG